MLIGTVVSWVGFPSFCPAHSSQDCSLEEGNQPGKAAEGGPQVLQLTRSDADVTDIWMDTNPLTLIHT